MESVPNIYAMVPYFDRVQISQFHPFRYSFRLIADTEYELQTELEKIKSLMIPSYMMEFRKLLDRISSSCSGTIRRFSGRNTGFCFCGNMLLGGGPLMGQINTSKDKYWKINLIDLVSIIPNPINRIIFSRNTRHLSRTSKEIYSLIRKRKNVNGDWIDEKIEFWVANSDSIDDEEREFLFSSPP
ncbi:hypothetical protein IEQ34_026291 [Dendrobium chrysotoxum]|uniref:Ycf2 N-terminal domain-containing protein n=1 Tax=Dendrobium chrysotoxum TaxID=161865 RepID=A0AAV7FNG8_DENCH|nr:hypothetical protein IEQ34_026291 [Dendrobium chrysotoxum]